MRPKAREKKMGVQRCNGDCVIYITKGGRDGERVFFEGFRGVLLLWSSREGFISRLSASGWVLCNSTEGIKWARSGINNSCNERKGARCSSPFFSDEKGFDAKTLN